MLLLSGILLIIATLVVFVLTFLANMQSPTGRTEVSWWPSVVLALITVACFVARHFLAGHPLTW